MTRLEQYRNLQKEINKFHADLEKFKSGVWCAMYADGAGQRIKFECDSQLFTSGTVGKLLARAINANLSSILASFDIESKKMLKEYQIATMEEFAATMAGEVLQ